MHNIIVFGIGNIAIHRHIPTLLHNKRVQVVGVVNKTHDGCQEVCKRFHIPHSWTFEEIQKHPPVNVDGAVVCVPPMEHAGVIQFALRQQWHVLTEKPYTLSVDTGEELIQCARGSNTTLSVVQNFQFTSSFTRAMADIVNGMYGTVHSVFGFQCSNLERRLPRWYEDIPLGLFYDEAPHFLYLLRRFSNESLQLKKALIVKKNNRETPLQVSMSFLSNTMPMHISMNFDAPISEWYLTIYGDRYVGVIDIFRDVYMRIPNDHQHFPLDILRTSRVTTWQHWLGVCKTAIRVIGKRQYFGNDFLIDKWLTQIETGVVAQEISALEGLEVVKCLHQIKETATYVTLQE